MARVLDIVRTGVLLVLSAIGAFATAQDAPLPTLEPLTPIVEGLPRNVITFVARVHNPTGPTQRVQAQLAVPGGWQVLIPPEPLTLASGATQVMTFSVLVAADAKAGTYTFPLGLYRDGQPGRAEAFFTVRVREVHRLDVIVIEAPALVIAESYQARFQVSNTGNIAEEIDLSVNPDQGFQVSVEPQSLRLAPGEAREVLVSVEPPGDLREKRVHDLQLIARAREAPNVEALARVRVEIIPRQLNSLAAYHTFPLTVRFTGGLAANLSLSDFGAVVPTFGVEITGSGRLWENDPGRFTVHLSGTLDAQQRRLFARYAHPDFLVAVGDQEYALSPLVAGGSGFGITASARAQAAPGVELGASAAAYDAKGGAGAALQVSAAIGDEIELSAQLLSTPEASVASARLQLLSVPLPTLVPHTIHLDAEYAMGITADPTLQGNAFRVLGGVRTEKGSMQASYEWRDAAFDQTASHRSSVEFTARFQLNDALRIELAPPVELSLAYQNTSEYAPDAGGPEGAGRRETTYSAALSGQVGGVNMLAQYRQSTKEDATTETTDHESTLQASAGVSLGGGAALQQTLAWKQTTSTTQPAPQNELAYTAQARTHLGDSGTLEATFGATYQLERREVAQLKLGATWTGAVTPQLRAAIGGELHLIGSEMIQITGSGSYQLGGGQVLDFDLWAKTYWDRNPDLRLGVAYSFPVDLRLGRLSSISEMTGIITDETGAGLPGITLQLAGASVASGADGRFHFPAVPAGEHYLTIRPEALSPDQLVTPALPYRIDLPPGGEATIELRVVRAATVHGQLRLHRPDPTPGANAPHGQTHPTPSDIELRGVLIELSNGDIAHRTHTSTSGGFAFTGLLPGTWQLRIHRGNWPEEYRLERTEYVLDLAPGVEASIDITVIFEPRTIRFIDGGSTGDPIAPQELPPPPEQP